MIEISAAQWYAWIAAFLWPFLRVLGLIIAEPVLGNNSVPLRVRMGLGIFITLAIAPTLAPMPPVEPASAAGLLIGAQQLLIGLAIGFTVRIALTATEMAGQLMGLQMGLGFAVFFDPQSSAQTAVMGQFLGLFATLIFLSINGHAMLLSALAESFRLIPIDAVPLDSSGLRALLTFAGVIFQAGLIISLPVVAALLIANVAVGIMTRAAPQLNIFAVGFPVTLTVGFVALWLALPFIGPALVQLFERAGTAMLDIAAQFAPSRR